MDLKQVVDKYRHGQQPYDWEPRKQRWLAELDSLFGQIRQMLETVGIADADVRTTETSIMEESLGQYRAHQLEVSLGGHKVLFQPVASVIIGGYGRVDLKGPASTVKIVAEDREERPNDKRPAHEREWIWRIYLDSPRRSMAFDSTGLALALERVLGEP